MASDLIASSLANAFLIAKPELDEVVNRWCRVLGKRWRWLRPLARRVIENFAGDLRPRETTVTRFIAADRGFQRAKLKHDLELAECVSDGKPSMWPIEAAATWQVPSIRTAGELADWLDIQVGQLDWLADTRSLEANWYRGRRRHYHYRLLAKRFGQCRLIESPKPRLKQLQRKILRGILDKIPPHEATHGFRRGRSITTFAQPHVGKTIVLKVDLQDFFLSVRRARIQAIFRSVGYPENVADLLAGLSTNSAPKDAWDSWPGSGISPGSNQLRLLYSQPHLPQGAPTSPALANLSAYRLDCRLTALARSAGAGYTRYADDIVFSGPRVFERNVKRFHLHACATILEEGFRIHHRKTRVMRQGVRQQIAGLVINERLGIRRQDFDALKATLTNCVRYGPQTQNREGHPDFRAHLAGRLSFIEKLSPDRGRRLRSLFEQVVW